MQSFKPTGVCAKGIEFDVVDGRLKGVSFAGGCAGNLSAMSVLLEGMEVEEAVTKLQGITCGKKTTSCADQLTKALKQHEEGQLVQAPVALRMA